jgi:hypothetical protein
MKRTTIKHCNYVHFLEICFQKKNTQTYFICCKYKEKHFFHLTGIIFNILSIDFFFVAPVFAFYVLQIFENFIKINKFHFNALSMICFMR